MVYRLGNLGPRSFDTCTWLKRRDQCRERVNLGRQLGDPDLDIRGRVRRVVVDLLSGPSRRGLRDRIVAVPRGQLRAAAAGRHGRRRAPPVALARTAEAGEPVLGRRHSEGDELVDFDDGDDGQVCCLEQDDACLSEFVVRGQE